MSDPLLDSSLDLISARQSLLLVIDLQDKLLPHIANADSILEQSVRLIDASKIFEIPITVTVQYPDGLGSVNPAIQAITDATQYREKLLFSGGPATGWPRACERDDSRNHVILIGIETHICILQTALDLLAWGYRVFIVTDAVSSQRTMDHEVALERLRDSGATVTTTESVMFEWCREAGTDAFRQLRTLIKPKQ